MTHKSVKKFGRKGRNMQENRFKIHNFYLPEQVKFVIDRLNNHGFEAFAVGGCVRDTVMGRKPGDYDVTTSALPEQMTEIFSDTKTVETGLKHGTLTIVKDGMNVETTTYRVDGSYTDHRRPDTVTFTSSLALDLSRRDFTINAMAYNNCEIIDLFGGFRDIKDKIVRCVGRAEERYNEDGLRILRAIRFASVLDFGLDSECSQAVHNMKEMLTNISRERTYVEITKLLGGKGAERILREYSDVIAAAFPGIEQEQVEDASYAFRKTKNDDKAESDVLYALLISELNEDNALKLIKSLKMSKADEKSIITIYRNRERFSQDNDVVNEKSVRRLMYETDDAFPRKLAQYMCKKCSNREKKAEEIAKITDKIVCENLPRKLKDLEINGKDILEYYGVNLKKEHYSVILDDLMMDVIDGKVRNRREDLLTRVGEIEEEIKVREEQTFKTKND